MTSQIRRSASSIGANPAEGCGRGSDKELAHYAQIALGSASELEYHLLVAHDLDLLMPDRHDLFNELTCEVKKMLASLIKTLRSTG